MTEVPSRQQDDNLQGEGETAFLLRFLGIAAIVGTLSFGLIAILHWLVPDAVRAGSEPWPIEAWAGSLALSYLLVAGLLALRRRNRLMTLLPLACVLLVGLFWLAFVRQTSQPRWDFGCFYRAGLAVRHGVNIYDVAAMHGYRYLYSPLLATLFSAAEWLPDASRHFLAFGLWSIGNYWSLLLLLVLLAAALRQYRVSSPYLWPALAAALLCNVPLQRTLIYSQPNLHVTNLILAFLLLYRRRPALAGGMLAGAALLKTSPLLLLLPVLIERRGRPVAGFLVGAGLLVGASVALVGPRPWLQFTHSLAITHSHGLYRDNSLQSLLINLGGLLHLPPQSFTLTLVSVAATAAATALLLALAFRPATRKLFVGGAEPRLLEGVLPFALAAMTIASPRVWEHHWVFMLLPFCLLIARARGTQFFVPALLSYGLVFLVPTFDVFPLSYHHLAGLVWWAIIAVQLSAAHAIASETAAVSDRPTPESGPLPAPE